MKFKPGNSKLRRHIDHYWIVNSLLHDSANSINLTSYPGINPELIIPLQGSFRYSYLGKTFKTERSILFCFISENVISDLSALPSFVVVTFKAKGISSILPFLNLKTCEIIKNPVQSANLLLGDNIDSLQSYLRDKSTESIVNELDTYFTQIFNTEKEGFVTDIVLSYEDQFSVKQLMDITNYSYSTIERYFKKETGLTPKQFLKLKRFKSALAYYFESGKTDWMEYVVRFGYHDQSHFIREFKTITGYTPKVLSQIPCLLSLRPDLAFMTNLYNQ